MVGFLGFWANPFQEMFTREMCLTQNQIVYQRNPTPTVVYQPPQPSAQQQNYFAQQQFVHTQRQAYDYGQQQQQQNVVYVQSATRQQQVNQTGQTIVVMEDHAQQGEVFDAGHSVQGDDFGQQQYIQYVENPVRQSVRHISASAGSADKGITYQIVQPIGNANQLSLDQDNYDNQQQQALVHVPRQDLGFIPQGQHQLQQNVADTRHQQPQQHDLGYVIPQGQTQPPQTVADSRQQQLQQHDLGYVIPQRQTQPPQTVVDSRQQQQPPPPQHQQQSSGPHRRNSATTNSC